MRALAEIVIGGALSACFLRLVLALAPLFGGNSLRRVRRQIRRNAIVFRPAGWRPWWKFW
jgi:hypothetical protein